MSRVCPSCGRRLPKSVSVCRCGLEVLAAEDEAADETGPAGGRSPATLAAGALLLAALAGAGYWFVSAPGAADAEGQRAITSPADPENLRAPSAGDPAQSTADPPAEVSLARRAWDAERALADMRPAGDAAPAPAPVAAPMAAASIEDMVGLVMPAVVLVETSTGRGSGFFVRPDTVITNAHVVKDDGFVRLRRMDGTNTTARVDLKSPAFDIAILKVAAAAAGQVVIPMGSAETLRPGQEVVMIGSALGTLQNSVTRGIVSGVRRSGEATLVQTDASANPGNSGGPLLDRQGVAIGITTMGYRDQQGLNFAVAIDHARAILEGRVAPPGSLPLALDEVKALPPAGSDADRVRDEGQRAFLAAIGQLARQADALDGDWRQFRRSCFTATISGSFSREWFVMFTPGAITAAQSGGGSCAAFLVEFQADTGRMAAEMRAALDRARRTSVLPGVVRDALRSSRLEFDGWDR